eukprot:TRINITY_DN15874_c0_g1_i1.p1 TRINITY_DN15874_c0_g1~~TRINITY_DN15874_c0_g1_i1.p1  ORF type:complete len:196 (-),score=32.53 TRINITY_DN15874_c0_g1_i1:2-589(-)
MAAVNTFSRPVLPQNAGDITPPPSLVASESDVSVFVSNILLHERHSVTALLEQQHSKLLRDLRSILSGSSVLADGVLRTCGAESDCVQFDVAGGDEGCGITSDAAPLCAEGFEDDVAERAEALDREVRESDTFDPFFSSRIYPEVDHGSSLFKKVFLLEVACTAVVTVLEAWSTVRDARFRAGVSDEKWGRIAER